MDVIIKSNYEVDENGIPKGMEFDSEELEKADDDDGRSNKSYMYNCYYELAKGTHEIKLNSVHFWRRLRHLCPSIVIKNAHKKGKNGRFLLPTYEKALEEYKNIYGL